MDSTVSDVPLPPQDSQAEGLTLALWNVTTGQVSCDWQESDSHPKNVINGSRAMWQTLSGPRVQVSPAIIRDMEGNLSSSRFGEWYGPSLPPRGGCDSLAFHKIPPWNTCVDLAFGPGPFLGLLSSKDAGVWAAVWPLCGCTLQRRWELDAVFWIFSGSRSKRWIHPNTWHPCLYWSGILQCLAVGHSGMVLTYVLMMLCEWHTYIYEIWKMNQSINNSILLLYWVPSAPYLTLI